MTIVRKGALLLVVLGLVAANTACGSTFDVSIKDFKFLPKITVQSDNADHVKWTNNGSATHSTTSDGGGVFWDSPDLAPAGTFSQSFFDSGNFDYHCRFHPDLMKGTVKVPMTVYPPSGATGDSFSIYWASDDTLDPPSIPAGFNADVQLLRPDNPTIKKWRYNQTGSQTSDSYTPDKKGKYKFRARLQSDTGDKFASKFSDWVTITVS